MATKGADPEALTALATKLNASASELEGIHHSLRTSLYSVGWGGWDADSFRTDWDGVHAAAFQQAVEALRAAATTLNRNAAEQRQTSAAETGRGLERHLTGPGGAAATGIGSGLTRPNVISPEDTDKAVLLGQKWRSWANRVAHLDEPLSKASAGFTVAGAAWAAVQIARDTQWDKLDSSPVERLHLAERGLMVAAAPALAIPAVGPAVSAGLAGASLVLSTGEWIADNQVQIEHTASDAWHAVNHLWNQALSWL